MKRMRSLAGPAVVPAVGSVVVSVVLAVVPAAASAGPADPADGFRQRLDRVRSDIGQTRSAMATGSLLDAVQATAALSGPVPPVPVTEPAPVPPGVPAALVTPIARLLGAIAYAGGTGQQPMPPGGKLAVAAAIDRALPALAGYASKHPTQAGKAVAGCDLVDALPRLCVGSAAANVYTRDAALLVDLGGNDRHANSAGGADPGLPFPPPGGNGLPVAVTIDVAGSDLYQTSLPTPSGARVAQGAGYGGIGFLVDRAGDDRYAVINDAPFPASLGALGQGLAILGTGVLADLRGDDRYLIESHPEGTQAMGPGGTSGGAVAGAGDALLYDASGDDHYRAYSRAVPTDVAGTRHLGEPSVIAYGAGFDGGSAVFFDGRGRDTLSAVAETEPVAPGDTRPLATGNALVYAFGYGSAVPAAGGTGMALSGPGPTVRRAVARVAAPQAGYVGAYAFGHGSAGGTGVLSDAGGDDRYVAEAGAWAVAKGVRDGAVTAKTGPVVAGGFGHAGKIGLSPNANQNNTLDTGGLALMEDLAGDDRYVMTATSSARATAAAGAEPRATTGGATAEGQGYGTRALERADSKPGAGFSYDGGGDDVYQVTVASRATARARTGVAGQSSAGPAASFVQASGLGGGLGELRDRGGDDRYLALTHLSPGGLPGGAPGPAPGAATTSSQASVEQGGYALLMDTGGGPDWFFQVPADRPCHGVRGRGMWRDCGVELGQGMNR
jgi:hypothetical protein